MPAVPKRKLSKARGRKRHSHWKLEAPRLVTCPDCDAAMLPHQVCPSCGKYRGVQVIEIKEK